MTGKCYVALGGAAAKEFRTIDLQTISKKELTTLIFNEAGRDDVYEPHNEKKANKELERVDTLFSHNNANVNVKFTLHCSKKTYIEKSKNFLAGNQESLPIDSAIDVKKQYGVKFDGDQKIKAFMKIEQVINKELAALALNENDAEAHTKYNPRMFVAAVEQNEPQEDCKVSKKL